MSPAALIDSTTITMQQTRRSSLPKNPNNPNPSLFDFSGISSNTRYADSNSINGAGARTTGAGDGTYDFDQSFVSPSASRVGLEEPQIRSAAAAGSGRSMPRMMKVRRQGGAAAGSQRSRSRSNSEAQVNNSEFVNPCRVDDANSLQELRDKYRSWNPFQSESKGGGAGGGSHSSGSSVSGDFDGGKMDDAGFVFGASFSSSAASNSVSERNSFFGESLGKSLPDEMCKLNLGSGKKFDGGRKEEKKDEDVFVFGSASKSTAGFDRTAAASSLSDEMRRKLNVESSGVDKAKDANLGTRSNDFVFTANVDTELDDELKKLNIEDSRNVGGFEKRKDGAFKSKVHNENFVFGSNKKDGSSSHGTAASVLSDELKKLNVEGAGDGIRVEEPKGASSTVKKKDTFVFGTKKDDGSLSGSTADNLPDEMTKLNVGSKIGGDSSAKVFTSSTVFDKNLKPGKSSENSFHEPPVASSIPTPMSFNADNSSRNSRVSLNPTAPQKDDYKSTEAPGSSQQFSSKGPMFQSASKAFDVPTADGPGNKANFSFGRTIDQFGTSQMAFKTPKQDTSFSSTGNVFAASNPKLVFSASKAAVKDSKVKKKKGKVRRPASVHPSSGQNFFSRESSSQENPESPGHYSPMDFSPYQETSAVDQSSRDTSVTSDEFFNFTENNQSPDAQPSGSMDATDGDMITATENLKISGADTKCKELNEEGSRHHFEKGDYARCPSEEFVTKAESERSESKFEEMDVRSETSVAASENESGLQSNSESKENDCKMQFCFASSSEDASGSNFTFAASTSAPGFTSSAKRQQRKKNRLKVGQESFSSANSKMQFASPSMQLFSLSGSSPQLGIGEIKPLDSSTSQSKGENKGVVEKELKQGFMSAAAAILATQEACEKWRLRGNQAYANGSLLKAEEYYTRGVNCVSANETSKSCLSALVLCYSNRAAARMTAGRMREALWDCTKAAEIDPDFIKVQVRAANCHLALGEIEDALKYFNNSLPSGAELCLDRKIVIEASNGLQKAQRVAGYLDCCADLLRQRTSNDAQNALQLINEAMSISPYSEKLIEMKAEALLMLRKYDEAIQLCEESLDSAEKNSPSLGANSRLENLYDSESTTYSPARMWRWRLMAKSYFYLGRLEEALSFLEKQEQAESVTHKVGSNTRSSPITLAVTICELLRHKAAGNDAFQSGRHSEAVDHYTAALTCNIESRPFAAICFCNRAAAYQASGQITDAIADCSLAIALDGNYPKAISRRSTLHELIRDHGQAAVDLQRLVSILEKQVEDKSNHSGTLGRSNSSIIDLRQVSSRLSSVEEEARKGISLNFYLILGIEPSGTASDIKKAYRKAALRHHPDKAGQFLARNESGDDRLWKEIAEEVHKDADRLFKMIGEAYAVLSDPIKRAQYDSEEIKIAKKKGNECSTSRTSSDFPNYPNYPFQRSGSRRQWQDVRRSYRNRSPQR